MQQFIRKQFTYHRIKFKASALHYINSAIHLSKEVLMKGSSIMPLYWAVRHQALIDLQRQIGYPTLFFTIAPYEWSFPYHDYVLDEMAKALRSRLHLPAGETLHLAHVFKMPAAVLHLHATQIGKATGSVF